MQCPVCRLVLEDRPERCQRCGAGLSLVHLIQGHSDRLLEEAGAALQAESDPHVARAKLQVVQVLGGEQATLATELLAEVPLQVAEDASAVHVPQPQAAGVEPVAVSAPPAARWRPGTLALLATGCIAAVSLLGWVLTSSSASGTVGRLQGEVSRLGDDKAELERAIKAAQEAAARQPVAQPAPAPLAPQVRDESYIVVREGDTLWRLSEEFYGDGALYTRLVEINHLQPPYVIRPKQQLRLGR